MSISPSRFGFCALLAGILGCAATSAAAQAYPSKPINLVVTLPAGSTVDALARVFGQQVMAGLKQPTVIDNKTGASQVLGMQALATAPADGYTLAFTPVTPLTIQLNRGKKLSYTMSSFIPLCQTFENVFFLAVPNTSSIKDFKDFLAQAKARPGKLNYGHSGVGSSPHLMAEELWQDLGAAVGDIPYRGETAFAPGLLSGEVTAGMVTTALAKQHHLRPLVVFAPSRSTSYPDVPTTAEVGTQVPASAYGGVFVRSDTSPEIISKLEVACRAAVESPAYQAAAEAQSQNATYLDRAAFTKRLNEDAKSKAKLLQTIKLSE